MLSFFLKDLRFSLILGLLISFVFVFFIIYFGEFQGFTAIWLWFLRFGHVVSGIIWLGLLYYFNFVQIPSMKEIPESQKPAINKYIAPLALWWFRWSAVSTILLGLLLAHQQGYLLEAFFLSKSHWAIGLGMYIGIIMFLNVWLIIWPNQKIVLGLIESDNKTKQYSSRQALLFSRINTVLSIPMLVSMTVHQNLFA